MKKQKVLKRVKFWAESRLVPPESRFRGVLCLSYFNATGNSQSKKLLQRTNWPAAKLEPKYLSSLVQFTEEVPLDVKWSLVVQSLRPHYVHLFETDVVEFNLLAAWLLAKITHKGIIVNIESCGVNMFYNCRIGPDRSCVLRSGFARHFGKSHAPSRRALLIAVQKEHWRSYR